MLKISCGLACLVCLALPKFGGVGGVRYVPYSPCPSLFGYFESQTSEVFGAMKFKNDLSGLYDLEVNMSIATVTDKNIRISQRTEQHEIQKGADIEYYVHFPYNHTFPKLTSVTFNGLLYCVGQPEEADDSHGVTSLSATNSMTTTIKRPFVQGPACGANLDYKPLVFSGRSTRSGEYPWLVAIFTVEGVGGYAFICAGNLISTRHVLTAAHCLRDILGSNVAKEDLVLVMGKHNIKNWARNSTIRSVADYYMHPEYRLPADADIAVLVMDEAVTYGVTVRPVCVWDESDDLERVVNTKGTVAGWGKDESGVRHVMEPKQIRLPIVSQEACLRSDIRFTRLTSTRTFCAGSINEKRGPCSGDSGGGLVINRDGIWKLRGIVSISLLDPDTRTCDINNYVVFSDVSKYTVWIRKVMDTTP